MNKLKQKGGTEKMTFPFGSTDTAGKRGLREPTFIEQPLNAKHFIEGISF